MKYSKLLSFAICMMFCTGAMATNSQDSETHEIVHIKVSSQGRGEVDRGIFQNGNAWYSSDMSIIQVEYDGIESPNIYVLAPNGTIWGTESTCGSSAIISIQAPTLPGLYALVIMADNYYGEGYFTVE